MSLVKALSLGFAAIVAAIALTWAAARPPATDAFYAFHDSIPLPGTLLRSERFNRAVPDGGLGLRILYATTRADGSPAVASAIVLVPAGKSASKRLAVVWAHGTTGVAQGCAPSLAAKPFANVPAVFTILREGWAFVATDYVGLGTPGGHAYLAGEDAARAVLDSAKAAQQIEDFHIGRQVVIWGHSQGGHSALWAGIRAAAYAPDIDVAGIIAMAPASDLPSLIKRAQTSMFGKIVSSYAISAYAQAYPDVKIENYLDVGSRWLVSDIAERCVGGWQTLFSAVQTYLLPSGGIFERNPVDGAFGDRLRQNVPSAPIKSPVMIAQGKEDDLVFEQVQAEYTTSRCAVGQAIDYRVFPNLDHISLVADDSPLASTAIKWTADRFAGLPATPNC
jgi:alpha-beta hydrolase superfamily lysophospholipase